MIIAGIDPGKSGALAITYPDGSAGFFDVPRTKLKGKEVPAYNLWARQWSENLAMAQPSLIVIEHVSAMPGQGVTSMFNFGRTLGFVHGIACATIPSCPIHFVAPSVWKAKLGLLNSGKGASREKCRGLMPLTSPFLERVKDDGRAEAALLAYYGRKFI